MKLYQTCVGPIQTNCYFAADDQGNTAVIDPGADAEKLVALLEQQSLTPHRILLTHGHFDHIGAVKGIVARYPDVKVVIGKKDAPMLKRGVNMSMWGDFVKADDYTDLGADTEVSEGDEITVGTMTFRVLDTPGHTRGGVCYLCEKYLFSGDTLFRQEAGRTDLEGGDYSELLQSLRKLDLLKGDYNVLPGHEELTTLEEERRQNYYIKEARKCSL